MAKFRCAISAILDEKKSVHTKTVFRALDVFKESFTSDEIEFILCEDFGSQDGGAKVAQYIVRQGIDCVIGHYSSNSALGAVDIYAENNIPLLLPAATDDSLTRGRENTFRIPPSNKNIVNTLCSFLKIRGIRISEVIADANLYCENYKEKIKITIEREFDEGYQYNIDALIYIGTADKTESFIFDREKNNDIRIFIITDDAANQYLKLPDNIASEKVMGIGLSPLQLTNPSSSYLLKYKRKYNENPGVFFKETLIALEIVNYLKNKNDNLLTILNNEIIPTTLGTVSFTKGENKENNLCLWINRRNKSIPDTLFHFKTRD
ncbi:ABC transporter substrate-binding protein [Xenorhabdus siamensis]|uniref:ABC transporter substrate-binding protein n=1 Tax=Xenorhabdus siamensis TaxID=3136254 RepID=UPI0030F441E0